MTPHNVEARPSPIHGRGGFAVRPIMAGELVVEHHSIRQPFGGYNHSCDYNAGRDLDDMLFALRPIAEGEEVTINYNAFRPGLSGRIGCNCPVCRGPS
jgi:SET domain-containing protein